jgi:hypothetical protein
MDSTTPDIRPLAHQLIDRLQMDASWDDVMYHVYVRQCVDAGVNDSDANHVVDVEDVRQSFGLSR